jgi:hypothetical protein
MAALGAVYTPPWLVRRVLRLALDPLPRGLSPSALLRLRVVDPACGDGAFLLEAGQRLARALLRTRGESGPESRRRARVAVAGRCLMGVDLDGAALAAARLRLLRWAAGRRPDAALELALRRNLLEGDALAGAAGVGSFDWRGEHGPGQVLRAGGFHAVVGNPPFAEPKRYRTLLPGLDGALRRAGFRTVGAGKVDLALPFLELGVALLRPAGRLGFVIQSRFFRADYGRAARRWLAEGDLLVEVEDYGEAPIFAGRATYTAALVLAAGSSRARVRCFVDLASARRGRPQHAGQLRAGELGGGPWFFGAPRLDELSRELVRRHGRLGEHPVRVGVGLQLPLRSLYLLEPVALDERLLTGRNGLGEVVRLEREAVRPLCRNRSFFPLRADNRDAWVLFPYAIETEQTRELLFPEWERRCPLAAAYLQRNRTRLTAGTALCDGPERWHLYRYPKNLLDQARPKVLFPTTVLDTAAAVDKSGEVYLDNVRVLLLQAPVDLHALAALLSSSPFSALARRHAALSEGGWRQLNRQYLAAVPFPMQRLQALAAPLGALAQELQARQQAALDAGALEPPEASEQERLWRRLDEQCLKLYQLDAGERALLQGEPRRVSRTELLSRAISAAASRRAGPGGGG